MDQKIEARDSSVIHNVTQTSHVHFELADPISLRERSIMMERVKASWIDGILLPSLKNGTQLELQLDCTHSVSLQGIPSIRHLDDHRTWNHPRTLDVSFAERGEVIVIVGAAGSGKSTILLQLMDRLLGEAREKTLKPIPAIFQLSSWHRGQTIETWLTAQLIDAYEIPPSKARRWIEAGKILPLLDGLDEVPRVERPTCMAEVACFRRRNGLLPMALTCRESEFEEISIDFNINAVFRVRPLSAEQVQTFIGIRSETQHLLSALRNYPGLFDQLSTPLFLRIAVSAARQMNFSPATLPSESMYRDLLFEAYVRKVLNLPPNGPSDGQLRFLAILGWIASTMKASRLSVFVPELIQPSVLKTPFRIWLVTSGAGILVSLTLTCLVVSSVALFVANIDILALLGLFLFFYLLFAFTGNAVSNYYQLKWSWRKFKSDLGKLQFHKMFPLASNTADILALRILDLGFEEVVSNQRVSMRGKWIRNGVYAGYRAAIVVLVFWLTFGFLPLLDAALQGSTLFESVFYLVLFLPFALWVVPLIALRRGPSDWIRCLAIRLVLWRTEGVPIRFEAVCDEAVQSSLLKPLGAGYVFSHNLLQDFFVRRFT